MTTSLKNILFLTVSAFFLFSCTDENKVSDVLVNLESGTWDREVILENKLEITDTTQFYDISFFVRNEMKYDYYNLFANVQLIADTALVINETREFHLFDPISGSPESGSTFLIGKKMGGQYDHEFPLYQKLRFKTPGTYQFRVSQLMRNDDALQGVNAIGLKVYKSQND